MQQSAINIRNKKMKRIENYLERAIFASRWLVTPLYLGLCFSLLLLLYAFFDQMVGAINNIRDFHDDDVILHILELIDISLAGNLVILVIFSGYENFVSRMNIGKHKDMPLLHGTVDFAGLKLKILSSVIAISSIHLLELLLGLKDVSETRVMWTVIIYIVLVLSGLIMALMDHIATLTKKSKG
jgi:uncharacterized protein (TIGR00645 family)